MRLNILGYIFLILFTAKIFGFTDLSYWLVFLPLLIPAIAFAVFLLLVLIKAYIDAKLD